MIQTDIRTRLVDFFGEAVVAFCEQADISCRVLAQNEKYCDASQALRHLGASVDHWPIPPAGLFVLAERTMYLREINDLTIAHEFGHAIDLALGGDNYLSSRDARIRGAFVRASSFITPYAASTIDEYFAECVRAFHDINSSSCLQPPVSKQRLWSIDPKMAGILTTIFDEIHAGRVVPQRQIAA